MILAENSKELGPLEPFGRAVMCPITAHGKEAENNHAMDSPLEVVFLHVRLVAGEALVGELDKHPATVADLEGVLGGHGSCGWVVTEMKVTQDWGS